MAKLNKWWKVYLNDNEKKFFVGKDGKSGIARHPEYKWRSAESLSKESGLSVEKIEKILAKYAKQGMVMQNPKNPEQWGYWEVVAPNSNEDVKLSISEEDKKKRIEKADTTSKKAQKI